MNIELVKRLREETKMGVRDCVTALENSNWDYDAAVKTVYSFSTEKEELVDKSIDKNPLMELDVATGRIDIVFYDPEGRMIYRKGNIIDGTWEEKEVVVDKTKVPKLEAI